MQSLSYQTHNRISLVYGMLAEMSRGAKGIYDTSIGPDLAQSWETAADGLTWTFRLRPGLLWSNGEPLTAGHFVASWQRVLNPAVAAEGAGYLYVIRNAEDYNAGRLKDFSAVGVAAPDERTLLVKLAHPVPYLAALAALPSWYPINPRCLAKFGALDQHGANWTRPGNLVGNGEIGRAHV